MKGVPSRGYSLVELMITVAIMGIVVDILGPMVNYQRGLSISEIQREKAHQILEYVAESLSSGRKPLPASLERLQESLPQSKVELTQKGSLTQISVRWKANGKPENVSMVVFAKAGAR